MKKPSPEMIDKNAPEWGEAEFARAKPAAEVLPVALQAKLGIRRRGPNKTPTKQTVTIRLSPDVVDAFKVSGAGWQTRIDAALKDWLKTHRPA
ncbi:BrnA antitoxin family protein [Bordetella genomosp. 6]|uniref:BrnA antitoxin family protein n=1 Tax=Bordetella genomosp. 6 TaxID=463024 RepID=A0ABX4FAM0_9BORD|nr:BrnA antitoxin family protein [Bordetella genomosp. 6]OZI75339.1 hypothetical protein CAL23_15510 [Bordetella genomosp. 6]